MIKPIQVYPNPSNGLFKIETSANLNDAKITVFDFKGNIIYTKKPEIPFSNDLDISHLASGMYTIHVETSTLNQSLRLVKVE